MSLRANEIAAVVAELAPLAGARVNAVRVHGGRALTLDLLARGGPTALLLSAEADLARIHAATRRPPAPRTSLPLQAVLRRELLGARLAAVEAVPGDRVVTLRFERGGRACALVAELTGRHGNLFLVDGEGVVRASAVRNLSQRRRLVPGEPYEAPAPREADEGEVRFEPVAGTAFPLSAGIEAAYAEREAACALSEAKRRLRVPLRAAVGRMRRALARLAEEAARVPAAAADRRAADLLKQNLRAVARGQRRVTLTEWAQDGSHEVTLDLDPALGPRENMERFYRRHRRIVESAVRVESRAAEVRGRLAAAEALLVAVEAAAAPSLARIEREARRLGMGPRPEAPARPRKDQPAAPCRAPCRTFQTLAGLPVLVGKGAAENDQLTIRVARGNDLWLHARGIGGAHVVLRLGRGRAPDQESLLDAAHLAAWFSGARGEPVVDVAYTRAKCVRKPKGAAPGVVTYSQEKVIALRVESARIDRLLRSEGGAAPDAADPVPDVEWGAGCRDAARDAVPDVE
jgi:predicted ribosome quality control (RQC) complex YloA/Tae2 family protein